MKRPDASLRGVSGDPRPAPVVGPERPTLLERFLHRIPRPYPVAALLLALLPFGFLVASLVDRRNPFALWGEHLLPSQVLGNLGWNVAIFATGFRGRFGIG